MLVGRLNDSYVCPSPFDPFFHWMGWAMSVVKVSTCKLQSHSWDPFYRFFSTNFSTANSFMLRDNAKIAQENIFWSCTANRHHRKWKRVENVCCYFGIEAKKGQVKCDLKIAKLNLSQLNIDAQSHFSLFSISWLSSLWHSIEINLNLPMTALEWQNVKTKYQISFNIQFGQINNFPIGNFGAFQWSIGNGQHALELLFGVHCYQNHIFFCSYIRTLPSVESFIDIISLVLNNVYFS